MEKERHKGRKWERWEPGLGKVVFFYRGVNGESCLSITCTKTGYQRIKRDECVI